MSNLIFLDIDDTILTNELYPHCLIKGIFNLDKYRELQEADDSLELYLNSKALPLLKWFHKNKDNYKVLFLTSRYLFENDKKQLQYFNIPLSQVISRDLVGELGYDFLLNQPCGIYKSVILNHFKGLGYNPIMIDDSANVKKYVRAGSFTMLCANKLNNRLSYV